MKSCWEILAITETTDLKAIKKAYSKMVRQYHPEDVYKRQIQELTTAFQKCYHRTGNFAVQLYGHVELMLSEYCPIQACLKDDGKKQCGLCRKATRYNLKDLKGHRYPILSDVHCRIHLLSEDAYDPVSYTHL